MSEELELFEDLLRDWIKFGMSDHFTPEEMQEKVEGWKRIREKLESNKRPRGRPSKGETYTFMFNRHVIEFRLAERGETRKKAIQGSWPDSWVGVRVRLVNTSARTGSIMRKLLIS
jgi:hypothetical protein